MPALEKKAQLSLVYELCGEGGEGQIPATPQQQWLTTVYDPLYAQALRGAASGQESEAEAEARALGSFKVQST